MDPKPTWRARPPADYPIAIRLRRSRRAANSMRKVTSANTAVLGDLGVNECSAVGLELGERPFLVSAHEAAVASDIGRQDGCKASLYALGNQGDLRLNHRDHTTDLPAARISHAYAMTLGDASHPTTRP